VSSRAVSELSAVVVDRLLAIAVLVVVAAAAAAVSTTSVVCAWLAASELQT